MTEAPSLAVWKFASCDGCQLTLLDCEEELLALTTRVRIASFPEMSQAVQAGPYDLSLVEGSITTPADAARIAEVRRVSRRLVAIGACATAGGIQALRNYAAAGGYPAAVYAHPEYLEVLERSEPVSAHVAVDFELHGCPIERHQLLEVMTALLAGRRPVVPAHAVCAECKAQGWICVLVTAGLPCLGPVTRAGCGARCPAVGRPCYGCFGPSDGANPAALTGRFLADGTDRDDVIRLFRTFTPTEPGLPPEGPRT